MFWLRSGPITSQEITYPDLVVARTVSVIMNVALRLELDVRVSAFAFSQRLFLN